MLKNKTITLSTQAPFAREDPMTKDTYLSSNRRANFIEEDMEANKATLRKRHRPFGNYYLGPAPRIRPPADPEPKIAGLSVVPPSFQAAIKQENDCTSSRSKSLIPIGSDAFAMEYKKSRAAFEHNMGRVKNTSIALVEDEEDNINNEQKERMQRKTKRQQQVETHCSFEGTYRDWVVGTIDALKAKRADPKQSSLDLC